MHLIIHPPMVLPLMASPDVVRVSGRLKDQGESYSFIDLNLKIWQELPPSVWRLMIGDHHDIISPDTVPGLLKAYRKAKFRFPDMEPDEQVHFKWMANWMCGKLFEYGGESAAYRDSLSSNPSDPKLLSGHILALYLNPMLDALDLSSVTTICLVVSNASCTGWANYIAWYLKRKKPSLKAQAYGMFVSYMHSIDMKLPTDHIDKWEGTDYLYPTLNYSDFNLDHYIIPTLYVQFATGCFWAKCTFCPRTRNYRYKRLRKPQVIDRMLTLARNYPKHSIWVMDRTLSVPMVNYLSEALLYNGMNTKWYCRLSLLSPDLYKKEEIKKWASSGLKAVQIGVETFSPRFLKRMNKAQKDMSVDQIKAILHRFMDEGIEVIPYMMGILPGQTDEELAFDMETIESLGCKHINYYIFRMHPTMDFYKNLPDEEKYGFYPMHLIDNFYMIDNPVQEKMISKYDYPPEIWLHFPPWYAE